MPLTDFLYSVDALRALETGATRRSGDGFALMDHAGQAAWRTLLDRWPQAAPLVVVCGPGNNGGDGYVLATLAQQAGRPVTVVRLAGHAPRTELARRACEDYQAAAGRVLEFDTDLPAAGVLVDALFGIGLSQAPDAEAADLIAAMNRHPAQVFALDVPSGVEADTGAVTGAVVAAACTLEFIAPKFGLRTGAARDQVGELRLDSLSIEADTLAAAEPVCELLGVGALARWLPRRRRDSHKGSYGRVLCVGGDHGHGGAILLAAEAALRAGAGLVDVVTRTPHVVALLARLPEAMGHGHADDADALDGTLLSAADIVVAGPGLGQGTWAQALYQQLLAAGKPLVLDADGLNLLAAGDGDGDGGGVPRGSVLTPHPGEAGRLLRISASAVQRDRLHAARAIAEHYAQTVVLKGAGTVVVCPGVRPRLIDAGNPGMAVGGMGDVLGGVIGALRAQGLSPFDAAACGALLHAAAGDAASRTDGERGLLPTDLMPWLRRLANPGKVA